MPRRVSKGSNLFFIIKGSKKEVKIEVVAIHIKATDAFANLIDP
jgi:hypothetical protein